MNDQPPVKKPVKTSQPPQPGQHLFILTLTVDPPEGEPYVLSRGAIPISIDPEIDQDDPKFRNELLEIAVEGMRALVEANKTEETV